jgi:ribosomal protein S27E
METEKLLQRNICLKKTQLDSAKQNGKAKNWQPKENAALKLATEQGFSIDQIVDYMNEDDELNYRWYTNNSIRNRRLRMKLGKSRYSPERDENILKCKKLLMEVGQSLVHYSNSHNITVKCNQCNHEWVKLAHKRTGCSRCSEGFKHPDPSAPGIFYYGPLLDSPINDLKLGVTLKRIGVEERSKNYGKFEWKEIHKPIGEGEKFEKKMKIKYEKYCTHNPMLKGNGSTECFDLIILPDLEKDIKEWLK